MNHDQLILCVDDEKIVLNSLKAQLTEVYGDDFVLEFAESAEEGLEVIEDATDDGVEVVMIISDWLMPDMKGDEFLIQVHQKYPDIVKVLLTGLVNEEAIKRSREQANLYAMVNKPWEKEVLLNTINDGVKR